MGVARFLLGLLGGLCLAAGSARADATPSYPLLFGKRLTRALWAPAAAREAARAPVVILVSGTGHNGPEGIVRAELTTDGKEHALLSELAGALQRGGMHTLCIGKPGVDFYPGGGRSASWYYDYELFRTLGWTDLVDTLGEAVALVRTFANVDPARIFVLGHSQGTQVAVDYAARDGALAGLILLGYSGSDMASLVDWQYFQRTIEHLVATDMDTDLDGLVTRQEAASWQDVTLPFDTAREALSYADIEAALRSNSHLSTMVTSMRDWPLYAHGVYDRGPLYDKTAALPQPLYLYTGALDVWTPPRDALRLLASCALVRKGDCEVSIVPGLGHGFSPPLGPRHHPLLDSSSGPVDAGFLATLEALALRLR